MNAANSADPVVTQDQILRTVENLRPDAVDSLLDLVAEPSLLGEEESAQDLMRRNFANLGLVVESFEIDESKHSKHPAWSPPIVPYDGRTNVVGIHRPRGQVHGRSLILNGHIDVVPVGAKALWTQPPFSPSVDGDRLYGRGSADMKAGIVACLIAMRALREMGVEPAAEVILQSVVEEECTGNGALACLVEGYTADAALIPEPLPGIMNGQMGVMWLNLEILGFPVHAAYAHDGVDAIGFAYYLLEALRKLEARWNAPAARHPLFADHKHPINFNLGKIHGGEWSSSVATQCRADLRLGFYPGVKPADVREEVESLLREAWAAHPAHDSIRYEVVYEGFQAEGLVVDMQQPIIETLIQCHNDIVGSSPEAMPFTGTTDAKIFHLYGEIPATCYGPQGSDIHGIDEWVSIDSMMQVAAVYTKLIARWCGLNRL